MLLTFSGKLVMTWGILGILLPNLCQYKIKLADIIVIGLFMVNRPITDKASYRPEWLSVVHYPNKYRGYSARVTCGGDCRYKEGSGECVRKWPWWHPSKTDVCAEENINLCEEKLVMIRRKTVSNIRTTKRNASHELRYLYQVVKCSPLVRSTNVRSIYSWCHSESAAMS